jgi:palmitoyltransferase
MFLSTLVTAIPRSSYQHKTHVDPQQIVLLVITFIFAIFTWGLHLAHVRYILLNLTTVEENIIRSSVLDRESTVLAEAYGPLSIFKHHQVRKLWTQEWGSPYREGNPWWLGSMRANWEMVCGENKLAWFR